MTQTEKKWQIEQGIWKLILSNTNRVKPGTLEEKVNYIKEGNMLL